MARLTRVHLIHIHRVPDPVLNARTDKSSGSFVKSSLFVQAESTLEKIFLELNFRVPGGLQKQQTAMTENVANDPTPLSIHHEAMT